MKKAGVCGHFGSGKNLLNGQTIKTKTVTDSLRACLGEDQIAVVDSHGGAKALPRLIVQSFLLFRKCENIVIMPANKGLRIFAPLFSFYNFFFHRNLHYVVIGGWLAGFIDQHKWLAGILKKFTGIYVETAAMKRALECRGFQNVSVMPNFKELDILTPQELNYQTQPPYKLCTFSRVMREKGIEDAAAAVKMVNEKSGRVVYTLDIYGQVDQGYADDFMELQKSFPAYVRYQGEVPYQESVETLQNYFALLFPTYYSGEGFAGTLLDAMAAGVPVIASDWKYNREIVIPGETGVLVGPRSPEQIAARLSCMAESPDDWNRMKITSLRQARLYVPGTALQVLLCKFV